MGVSDIAVERYLSTSSLDCFGLSTTIVEAIWMAGKTQIGFRDGRVTRRSPDTASTRPGSCQQLSRTPPRPSNTTSHSLSLPRFFHAISCSTLDSDTFPAVRRGFIDTSIGCLFALSRIKSCQRVHDCCPSIRSQGLQLVKLYAIEPLALNSSTSKVLSLLTKGRKRSPAERRIPVTVKKMERTTHQNFGLRND